MSDHNDKKLYSNIISVLCHVFSTGSRLNRLSLEPETEPISQTFEPELEPSSQTSKPEPEPSSQTSEPEPEPSSQTFEPEPEPQARKDPASRAWSLGQPGLAQAQPEPMLIITIYVELPDRKLFNISPILKTLKNYNSSQP